MKSAGCTKCGEAVATTGIDRASEKIIEAFIKKHQHRKKKK